MLVSGFDGTLLEVGATSKALRGTLYDAQGNTLSRPVPTAAGLVVGSYMVGLINTATLTASVPNYVLLNRSSSRRMRLRQLLMELSQFSVTAARTDTVTVQRAKFSSEYFTLSNNAVATVAVIFESFAKTYGAPPSNMLCLATATGVALGPRVDTQTLTAVAVPGQSFARVPFDIITDIDEPNAAIVLEPMEGLLFVPSNPVPTNAFMIHASWDEEMI